jgi:hypothetical protein
MIRSLIPNVKNSIGWDAEGGLLGGIEPVAFRVLEENHDASDVALRDQVGLESIRRRSTRPDERDPGDRHPGDTTVNDVADRFESAPGGIHQDRACQRAHPRIKRRAVLGRPPWRPPPLPAEHYA